MDKELAGAGIDELQAQLDQADEERATLAASLEQTKQQLAEATAAYREALVAAHPEVPRELIEGDTPEAVRASLERALGVVRSVEERLGRETQVPGGAAGRSDSLPEGVRGIGKIRHALRDA